MATHSSILVWRMPWTEEPGGLQPMGRKESDMSEVTKHHLVLNYFCVDKDFKSRGEKLPRKSDTLLFMGCEVHLNQDPKFKKLK